MILHKLGIVKGHLLTAPCHAEIRTALNEAIAEFMEYPTIVKPMPDVKAVIEKMVATELPPITEMVNIEKVADEVIAAKPPRKHHATTDEARQAQSARAKAMHARRKAAKESEIKSLPAMPKPGDIIDARKVDGKVYKVGRVITPSESMPIEDSESDEITATEPLDVIQTDGTKKRITVPSITDKAPPRKETPPDILIERHKDYIGTRTDGVMISTDWPDVKRMRSNGMPDERIMKSYGVEKEYFADFCASMEKMDKLRGTQPSGNF